VNKSEERRAEAVAAVEGGGGGAGVRGSVWKCGRGEGGRGEGVSGGVGGGLPFAETGIESTARDRAIALEPTLRTAP
jgi:hypothetical protein